MNFRRSVRFQACLFGLITLLVAAGCGKKGPPIPYDVTVPEPISDLDGMVREGKIFLAWSMPKAKGEGPEVMEIEEFLVLRHEAPLEEVWCDDCPEKLRRVDVIRMDGKKNFSVSGGHVIYQDQDVSLGHIYAYRIVSVTTRGDKSDPSNRSVVYWDEPPDAPTGLEGSAGDGSVTLAWQPVEQAEGYRVYRKPRGDDFQHVPTATGGATMLSYRDTGLHNGMAYQYVVRAIRRIERTWLEGPSSHEISITPRDLTPPSTPEGLLAIPVATGVELSWQRNPEADLLGYFVYRREQGESRYTRLIEAPVTIPMYVDTAAVIGKSYEYAVTAVDRSPQKNESFFSEPARLVYVR